MKRILIIAAAIVLSACAEKPREYVCNIATHSLASLSITSGKATYGRNTYTFCAKQGNYEIFSIKAKDCDPKNRDSESIRIEFDRITGALLMGFAQEGSNQIATCKQTN